VCVCVHVCVCDLDTGSVNSRQRASECLSQTSTSSLSTVSFPPAECMPSGGTRSRCDEDFSHSEPRCASSLNTQQQHQPWRDTADDRSRLISNHFCVNCLQLMVRLSLHALYLSASVTYQPETHTPRLSLIVTHLNKDVY